MPTATRSIVTMKASLAICYAKNDNEAKQLDDIYKGAMKVGVKVQYIPEVPTPVPFKKALVFNGQAQFHPLKYLLGLQKAYLEAGIIAIYAGKLKHTAPICRCWPLVVTVTLMKFTAAMVLTVILKNPST
jgi:hypothetical protein